MQTPLPTVESACASLQQEEAQREILGESSSVGEKAAMNSRTMKAQHEKTGGWSKPLHDEPCKVCGRRNHTTKECWHAKGNTKGGPVKKPYPKTFRIEGRSDQNWNKNKNPGFTNADGKFVGNVAGEEESNAVLSVLTPQVIKQLLNLASTPGTCQ